MAPAVADGRAAPAQVIMGIATVARFGRGVSDFPTASDSAIAQRENAKKRTNWRAASPVAHPRGARRRAPFWKSAQRVESSGE